MGVAEKYPTELLKERIKIEGNVISCIFKDPLLLDECSLTYKDFITKDGAYYYSLANNLRKKGFYSLDEVTILSSISDELQIGFNERGGWETIQNQIDIINDKNWEVYLDILYRENKLISMYNDGFNLLSPILINDKEIIPLDLFRTLDSESVTDWYEARLTSYSSGYSSKIIEEEELDIDDDYFEQCSLGENAGVLFDVAGLNKEGEMMTCFPFLSKQIDGFADGTFNMIAGYSSVGKTTLIVTLIMALLYRGRKVLIISNEQKSSVFKNQFIIWLLAKYSLYFKLSKKRLKNGDFTKEDKEQLEIIKKIWKEQYKGKIKFISIADANVSLVKKKIRENVLRYGYDTVIYDTMKIDFDSSSNGAERFSLIKDSREFDKIAKKYNIIMLASLQTAIYTTGKLFLDASVLSESKQIKEILESLLIMRATYREELDPDNKKFYCNPFRLKKQGGVWIEEPYEPDLTGIYRTLFPNKTRSGVNSDDDGIAYLLKYNGDMGTFSETAKCRPKHGKID